MSDTCSPIASAELKARNAGDDKRFATLLRIIATETFHFPANARPAFHPAADPQRVIVAIIELLSGAEVGFMAKERSCGAGFRAPSRHADAACMERSCR